MKTKRLFRCVVVLGALTTSVQSWAHDGDHSYVNGICTIEGCTDKYQAPALVDGWYEVANAGNVEWIGDYVQNVDINPKVKMVSDIDFTGASHTMIGRNAARKFNGIWDGQGHRITNLVLNYGSNDTPTAIGFFAWVRGGSIIKNMIMDKSCYFEGKVRVAAFVGVTQVAGGGAVRIENCINEANVQGHTGATGGFIGCRNPENQDTPQAIISGCANHGNILCDKNEAGAFVGWANGSGHIVENSYNTGTVSVDGNKRGFIRADGFSVTNSYDFGSNAANNSQNVSYSWTSADPVASGELAFHINQIAGKQIFYQNLGETADAAPVPFSTSGQVYAHGTYRCDGVLLPGTIYDNTPGEGVIPPHNYSTNGLCQNDGCTKPFQPAEEDGEGWTLLANAGNVEWFSNIVATGNGGTLGSYVAKAKLTADIDFENIENLHSPIGPSTGCKFKGEFDGQGHKIKNMIINRPDKEAQGFFGWLQGNSNTYVHDIIIDRTCSITAGNKAGGLAGASQNYNENATITLKNIVLGADVTVTGQDAGGLVGGESGDKANYRVQNVINLGNITSTHEFPYAGALFCYQERGTVENFVNLGTITGHNGGNIGRFGNENAWKNVVDLSATENINQGVVDGLTAADVANGNLAFFLNSTDNQDEDAFFQTIGTDAYPLPFNTSAQVYGHAWDGTAATIVADNSATIALDELTIDDNWQNFYTPTDVTINIQEINYSRSDVAGFNTVCLPFAFAASQLPEGAQLFVLDAINTTSVSLKTAESVQAGEPCLVRFPSNYTGSWDLTVNTNTELASAPKNKGTLKGSFTSGNIGEGKYKLNAEGTAFGITTAEGVVNPFRAYLDVVSEAHELSIVWDENDPTCIKEYSAGGKMVESYDLLGRQNQLVKGLNIVKMSDGKVKKVVLK